MTDIQQIEETINDDDDIPSNPVHGPTFGDIVAARYSRRGALKGLSAVAVMASLGSVYSVGTARSARAAVPYTTTFEELPHGVEAGEAVANGYDAVTLIRWGDPVVPGAPAFDPMNQSAAAQAKQWGYNNDYVGYLPLPAGSDSPDHGLLCVNFEYTNHQLMFPGIEKGELDKLTKEQVDIEMAAHGHGVIEIKRDGETWNVVADSPYNRRITTLETEMVLSGPAAGSDRLKTNTDDTGTKVIGTLNNCAGGKTPWGTILFAEENFHGYFGGDPNKTSEAVNYNRYGLKEKSGYAWSMHHDRFNVEKDPNEPNKFGWMVEFNPYDPESVPVKRTALGRFKHEGADALVNKDGRVVVYTGDDQRFDYVYKFVSNGTFDPAKGAANGDLMDDGILYVGKFGDDGKLAWLPLVFGTGPLTPENDFNSQADVLIETRRAADLLGATPMDRPEDVEHNPVSGIVYMNLTNNTKREGDQTDAANPRGPNPAGHIVEMIPPGGSMAADRDHAATEFTWEIFLLAGDPSNPEHGAMYHPETTANGWLGSPDNCAFDKEGRIWIATDGATKLGTADGVWAADTQGPGRGLPRLFYRTPLGAELCGPEFNADCTAYFAAVQHPADTKGSTFDNPSTRWPDFQDGVPARPSIQVIVKKGGGVIGT
jgi:secreted PhoX family phosphatase